MWSYAIYTIFLCVFSESSLSDDVSLSQPRVSSSSVSVFSSELIETYLKIGQSNCNVIFVIGIPTSCVLFLMFLNILIK